MPRFFLFISFLIACFCGSLPAMASDNQASSAEPANAKFEAYCTSYGSGGNFVIKRLKGNLFTYKNEKKHECVLQRNTGAENIALLPDTKASECQANLKSITLQSTDLNQDKLPALVEHENGRPENVLCTVIFRHKDIPCDFNDATRTALIKATDKIVGMLGAEKLINADYNTVRCSCLQTACTTKERRPCSAPAYTCTAGSDSGISLFFDHNLKLTGAQTFEP